MMSGIYAIFNTETGKVYIGSSATLTRRIGAHASKLRMGSHHSPYLQHSWNSRGPGVFAWTVIEECDVDSLVIREQFWMDRYQTNLPDHGYNCCPAAGSLRGFKFGPQSQEHRDKIGATHKGKINSAETRAKLSAALKGRAMSPEWVAKIVASRAGCKLPPLTAEHKAIVSAAHKGKIISDAHKLVLSKAHKGKKQAPEFIEKRRQGLLNYHEKRRERLEKS